MAYTGVATDTLQNIQGLKMAGAGSTNIKAIYHTTFAVTGASVVANNTAEQTFTVPGVAVGDVIFVNKPTLQSGLGIAGARVSGANTVAITFINATASPISPNNETYQLMGIR